MSLLLETTLGDLVIDLDVEGSPELCRNILKLAKARYYTSTLLYSIVDPTRFCQLGDPCGDGTGGACIHGLLDTYLSDDGGAKDVKRSKSRFMKSDLGRPLTELECQQRGRVVATEMNGIPNTIGSQFLITLGEGPGMALDGYASRQGGNADDDDAMGSTNDAVFRSLGVVAEDDDNVLEQIAKLYCDGSGRPYADVRIIRALVVHDPFDDPPGMDKLLIARQVAVEKVPPTTDGVDSDNDDDEDFISRVTASPIYDRPEEECVEERIAADQLDALDDDDDDEADVQKQRQIQEEDAEREDKSRAVVLEMLGDLPSAEIEAPDNVLFICKLNAITEDEDLELIFSRFDNDVKVEIIRDPESGASLQYAFAEFNSPKQAEQAYFKMNNALIDDRRIKVDFSQSVAKVWNRYNQKQAMPKKLPDADNRSKLLHPKGDLKPQGRRPSRFGPPADDHHQNHRNDYRHKNHQQHKNQNQYQRQHQQGRNGNSHDRSRFNSNGGRGGQGHDRQGGGDNRRSYDDRRRNHHDHNDNRDRRSNNNDRQHQHDDDRSSRHHHDNNHGRNRNDSRDRNNERADPHNDHSRRDGDRNDRRTSRWDRKEPRDRRPTDAVRERQSRSPPPAANSRRGGEDRTRFRDSHRSSNDDRRRHREDKSSSPVRHRSARHDSGAEHASDDERRHRGKEHRRSRHDSDDDGGGGHSDDDRRRHHKRRRSRHDSDNEDGSDGESDGRRERKHRRKHKHKKHHKSCSRKRHKESRRSDD